MSHDENRRAALRLVDRAVARLETTRPEALDRRRFLLAGGASLAAALLAACDAQGPDWARHYLKLLFYASEVSLFQSLLAHADYASAPRLEWPDSPAAESIANADPVVAP